MDDVDGVLRLVEDRRLVANLQRGLRVEIRSDEHPPPHFHVKAQSVSAAFAIADCQLLHGVVPAADMRVIRYWHERAKPTLIEVWDSTRPGGCTVGKFECT